MSYTDQEQAVFAGDPVELYKFTRRARCWPYTSYSENYEHETVTYRAVEIARKAISRTRESASAVVEITMQDSLALAQEFLGGLPPTPVSLTITRVHRSSAASDIILFSGTVANVSYSGGQATVRCVSPLSLQDKLVPRVKVQRQCPNVLYDKACGLNKADWAVAGTISAFVGGDTTKLTIAAASGYANDWFTDGFVRVDGTDVRGFIEDHSGTTITLRRPLGYPTTTAVTLYPGCDKLVDTCRTKFTNLPNFLGFPFHPVRSPFSQLPE